MGRLKNFVKSIWHAREANLRSERMQRALGRVELRQLRAIDPPDPNDWEFQVTSQSGEDGIIQYLLQRVPIEHKLFVEFGVEDYTEANTRFLLQNDGWGGLVMDGSAAHVAMIRQDALSWRANLNAQQAFITRENINDLLQRHGVTGDIGLLSIDIDGNDYWVWEAITAVQPRIVICEINPLFGPEAAISIPYDAKFQRGQAHFSHVYFGASLAALDHLARKKEYRLVAVTREGINAFFVRNDLTGSLKPLDGAQAWRPSPVRESRNAQGQLTFAPAAEQLRAIAHLPVVDVLTGETRRLGDVVNPSAFTLPDWSPER
jgi:hypothetical protein